MGYPDSLPVWSQFRGPCTIVVVATGLDTGTHRGPVFVLQVSSVPSALEAEEGEEVIIMRTDVVVHKAGSIILFEPQTVAGIDWLDDNCCAEDWQWSGNSLAVEWRMAEAIIEGLVEDGLKVRLV